MSAPRAIMRPSDLRRAVTDWVAQGCTVEIMPDGTVKVAPPSQGPERDAFDLVDMKR